MRAVLPLVLIVSAVLLGPSAASAATPAREWVLVYWMCYDNNLEGAGRPILDMLRKGVRDPRVAVVVAADFRDADGMTRFVLTDRGEASEPLATEGSTDPAVLAEQLAWVAAELPARRYAVIFVNHGGAQSKTCFDEHPSDGGAAWLEVPRVAEVLSAWRLGLADEAEVELLFMQQCGKGSVENYYELRGAARYVMASQTLVGAPNYYYTEALAALSRDPGAVDGRKLARLIMDAEAANMFTEYTAASSAALAELPARLDVVLAPLFDGAEDRVPSVEDRGQISFGFGRDEEFIDLIGGLTEWYAAAGLAQNPVKAFAGWVDSMLLAERRVSPLAAANQRRWSGLSVLLATQRAREAYAEYALYQDSRLDEWMEAFGLR